jgi:hypothetical protein
MAGRASARGSRRWWTLGLSVWATWVFRWRGVARLHLDEANGLGVPVEIAEVVARLWEATLNDEGADSDFTSAINRSSGPPASLPVGCERGE